MASGLSGLVLGWSLRAVAIRVDALLPRIGWLQAATLYLVALILALAARATHQALQRGERRLPPHQAVNRLVLAKACAIAGAFVTGGYLGHALSWVGVASDLGGSRILVSTVAAGGAVLMVAASLLLERACRVRDDDDEP